MMQVNDCLFLRQGNSMLRATFGAFAATDAGLLFDAGHRHQGAV